MNGRMTTSYSRCLVRELSSFQPPASSVQNSNRQTPPELEMDVTHTKQTREVPSNRQVLTHFSNKQTDPRLPALSGIEVSGVLAEGLVDVGDAGGGARREFRRRPGFEELLFAIDHGVDVVGSEFETVSVSVGICGNGGCAVAFAEYANGLHGAGSRFT